VAGALDVPAAAAAGLIPREDMVSEALNAAGTVMGLGGLLARPTGSLGMGGRVAPRSGDETPAQQVARLLREGRSDEVTDDIMAQADPQEMYQLYVSGETGMDLPMDEASRMARAREMGLDTDAFHATKATEDFQAFRPSWRGTNYFAVGPDEAMRGANAGAQDVGSRGAVTAQMPVMLRSAEVEGLNMGQTVRDFYDTLPQRIVGDEAVDAAMENRPRGYGLNWDTFYLEQRMPDGQYEYNLRPIGQTFQEAQRGYDELGMRLAGWNSGSDMQSLRRVQGEGQQGFLVSDEAGVSAAMGPNALIRSRFARFDPRLSHLSNLSAANIDPLTGAAAMGASQQQQDPLASLRAYLAQNGLLSQ
jgi:hypothetical protein